MKKYKINMNNPKPSVVIPRTVEFTEKWYFKNNGMGMGPLMKIKTVKVEVKKYDKTHTS